jgi:hypothetical protein
MVGRKAWGLWDLYFMRQVDLPLRASFGRQHKLGRKLSEAVTSGAAAVVHFPLKASGRGLIRQPNAGRKIEAHGGPRGLL